VYTSEKSETFHYKSINLKKGGKAMKLTNSFWKKAIEAVILVLTAIAGALGANAL
jgi:hypothetical protein